MMDQYYSISFTDDVKLAVNTRVNYTGELCREFIVSWYEGNSFMTQSFKDFFDASDYLKNKLLEEIKQ